MPRKNMSSGQKERIFTMFKEKRNREENLRFSSSLRKLSIPEDPAHQTTFSPDIAPQQSIIAFLEEMDKFWIQIGLSPKSQHRRQGMPEDIDFPHFQ